MIGMGDVNDALELRRLLAVSSANQMHQSQSGLSLYNVA